MFFMSVSSVMAADLPALIRDLLNGPEDSGAMIAQHGESFLKRGQVSLRRSHVTRNVAARPMLFV